MYGKSTASIKGNWTRIKPSPVLKYKVQIRRDRYKHNLNIELFIDFVYIHDVVFLVSIDRQVKYRSNIHITSQNEEAFFKGLDKILRKYNSAGLTITINHVYNDFKTSMDQVKDYLYITMNYGSPGDHVTDTEWNNIKFK